MTTIKYRSSKDFKFVAEKWKNTPVFLFLHGRMKREQGMIHFFID